ncbi:alpha/beta hydrolase [Chloroflexus sp.]|uniref:alpha/beta fold hydrolase n=1 Tax=Chloroflexus sp. TaxID=1904827 RepID=UPI00298F1481|nr:alpha/beta hydrolase [Chloroflexus sp.]MDW8405693.1 alpha/beta hydrolase [Chloroflexus sp.]
MTRNPMMDIPPTLVPYARRIALRDLEIFYYDAGSATSPTLFLIHGLGDEADTWRAIIPPLTQSYRIIAPDLPGFGRSSGPNSGYSLTFFARAMAEFIAALGLQQVTLVGHSLGAMIAQRLSIGLPHLIQQQILISGCLPIKRQWPPRNLWPLLVPGLGELILASMQRSRELAFLSLRPFYYNLYNLPAREQRFLRRRVWARLHHARQRRATLSALRWLAVDALFRADQYLDLVSECSIPTILIAGEHDLIVDGETIEATEVVLEGHGQYLHLEDCGHMPQQECPDLICELIAELVPAGHDDESSWLNERSDG